MKNQYVADINDYRKYGLLRILSGYGSISTGVCWMLTAPDERSDGKFLDYLEKRNRDKWRPFDPPLFDAMYKIIHIIKQRNVSYIEHAGVLPNTSFHSTVIQDAHSDRTSYFNAMANALCRADLIFFDPDNGLEVKSKPKGRSDSCKYLYRDELFRTYADGHSVLIYQHFCRENRDAFMKRVASSISEQTGPYIYSFRTSNVVFFLAAQSAKLHHFATQAQIVSSRWAGQIETIRHFKD
jgi:hypothetical protein